jgi:hypothetical protein
MSRVERDPERGRAAAAKLKALGAKRVLIKAAEQGYITQLACKMPECFCPEELGGACYFEPVTPELSDWMPTVEHYPLSQREGGKETVDNVLLAHRLCNRIDYSISDGRSYASDLKRIRKAREDAIRRNNEVAARAEICQVRPRGTTAGTTAPAITPLGSARDAESPLPERAFAQSGRLDLNQRPSGPQPERK